MSYTPVNGATPVPPGLTPTWSNAGAQPQHMRPPQAYTGRGPAPPTGTGPMGPAPASSIRGGPPMPPMPPQAPPMGQPPYAQPPYASGQFAQPPPPPGAPPASYSMASMSSPGGGPPSINYGTPTQGTPTGTPRLPVPSGFDAFDEDPDGPHDPYPAWSDETQIPLSKEEIEDVFIDLANKFGFQHDSMRNMYDHLMMQLDSRASRMPPMQALLTLHADYIGGEHANYRKWYFAAQLDLDDAIGAANSLNVRRLARAASHKSKSHMSLSNAEQRWRQAMAQMSSYDRIRQLALYLLVWGEAAQVRFAPECLCFIFKCADDYYRSPECQNRTDFVPEGQYLRSIVRPLYKFLRDQGYEVQDGAFLRRERDHEEVIGYDDVNMLFWYPEGIARIVLNDGTRLVDVAPQRRYLMFGRVVWNRCFFKTFKERRSFGHLLVNFNRILVLHISIFWMYTGYNSPSIYTSAKQPNENRRYSVVGLGGAVASFIMLLSSFCEWRYVKTNWSNTSIFLRRVLILGICLFLTIAPTVYIWGFNDSSSVAHGLSIAHFAVAIFLVVVFSVIPSGYVLGDQLFGSSRNFLASQTFTASYPGLPITSRLTSIGMWCLVFGCKLVESYFFLTLSFVNPVRVMVGMRVQICEDVVLKQALCYYHPAFTLAVMFCMDICLFFLDTFLWYVIWNTVLSLARSFFLGLSIWTPWKDIFERLPKRIYSKILASSDMEVKYKPKVLISQIWNAIIISMYREHLLSIDHVQRLLYHQVLSEQDGKRTLRAPVFFISQNSTGLKPEFFPPGSEAARRVSFFAQSLTVEVPKPLPVQAMPTFSVLTPHYSEKILLSLREIIREEDHHTRVTLLEYLKQLHPVEWDNFVRDTKILAEEANGGARIGTDTDSDEKSGRAKEKASDIPFYTIGFKSAAPEYTLRTRIWASLRAQTLYRTVSGFMNYSKAIKLLYRVENPDVVQQYGGNAHLLERELERMARRKFHFVVSMQRYARYSKEELENTEFLLRAYPDLNIAYIDEERMPPPPGSGQTQGESHMFSVLIDGHSEIMPNGKRRPKYRIELPGNPILGDGKSDNQNHALIFYRGEYLQLIDANQDNYLEECLKIRNILGEFEEYNLNPSSPYSSQGVSDTKNPVAIVGAREYIFSENIGILGDVAAGIEQTFGTLSARSMAFVGGKLHYGHPDFLNAIFMTTRGGVSKAQKGLHLNEDIYAGMNAHSRGGRIKHTEYYQCGKGRDLGFGTILNFQTKIGTGMGEQMLSRDYYFMGTQLPFDQFLTFYYGHPGYHINNILLILSLELFMLTFVYVGTLVSSLQTCQYGPNGNFEAARGCYNMVPVIDWIKRSIISIVIVMFVAYLPLFFQELTERGVVRAVMRILKHIFCLSFFFQIFSTQVSAHSILSSMTFGGARYIATGRGFATSRISFAILYSRFAGPCLYVGLRLMLLLVYVSISMWIDHFAYFWLSIAAFCIAPFLFNPHQFSLSEFIVDYREYMRWMSRGNSRAHANSWVGYCRLTRTRMTGFKKKRLGHPSEKLSADVRRPSWRSLIIDEVLGSIVMAFIFCIAYLFIQSVKRPRVNGLLRLAIVSLGPMAFNIALLFVLFLVSSCIGPMLSQGNARFGAVMAGIAHFGSLLGLIGFFELLFYIENWSAGHTCLGVIAIMSIQRAILKILTTIFLTRELKSDEINRAWWTGRWMGRGFGASGLLQFFREFIVKTVEMSLFAADFLCGHILLFMAFIPCLIPYVDTIHSTMLFWLRPSQQIRSPIFSTKQRAIRRGIILRYGILFVAVEAALIVGIILPIILRHVTDISCEICDQI